MLKAFHAGMVRPLAIRDSAYVHVDHLLILAVRDSAYVLVKQRGKGSEIQVDTVACLAWASPTGAARWPGCRGMRRHGGGLRGLLLALS